MWQFSGARILPLALVILGCAATSESVVYQRKQPFDPAVFEYYLSRGDGAIQGSAFLKTRGGDVKLGAGNVVVLVPHTPYTQEWLEVHVVKERRISPPDARLMDYQQTTVADAAGNFEFRNLRAGNYIVVCTINWEVPAARSGLEKTGGTAFAVVRIDSTETERVVVTRPDYSTLMQVNRGSGAANSAFIRVLLESGELLDASAVKPSSTGVVTITLDDGSIVTRGAHLIRSIVDTGGADRTKEVLRDGRALGL